MDINTVISFWLISMMFILTPGVDWAFAISAGLSGERIIPAILGLILGHGLALSIVVVGGGSLLSAYPFFVNTIALLGSLYIVWVSIELFRYPPMITNNRIDSSGKSAAAWVRKGVLVSGTNPKVMLLFLALLPQFITPSGLSPKLQLAILGVIHLTGCILVYFAVSAFAKNILSNAPLLAKKFSRFSALILLLLGAGLVYDAFVSLHNSI